MSYYSSGVDNIPVRLFTPAPAIFNKCAIVVAYGTEGLNAPFGKLIDDDFCQILADGGFLVARPDYLKKTGTAHGMESVLSALSKGEAPGWVSAIADAVRWVEKEPSHGIAPGCVATVGFSLGGNLVLQAAMKTPVKAVVDYFGPIESLPQVAISQSQLAGLPAIQMHHGEKDDFPFVPFSQSDVLLRDWLTQLKISFEMNSYPNQGHPGQFLNSWTSATQTAATAKTIKFLEDHM